MQHVVIKGRTYLHAYYVAKEYGYAPAYIRELYDTNKVVGVFWKGTLHLDAVSWQNHLDTQEDQATEKRALHEAAPTPPKEDPPPATNASTSHRYLHHAKLRSSQYEKDEHGLRPEPTKTTQTPAPAQQDQGQAKQESAEATPKKSEVTSKTEAVEAEAATPKQTSKRLSVTLADAESVPIATVGKAESSYTVGERATTAYSGKLAVEELFAEGDANDEEFVPLSERPEEDAKPTKGEEDTEASESEEAATDTKKEKKAWWWRRLWRRLAGSKLPKVAATAVMVLVVAAAVGSLFVERYTVVSEEVLESEWRISWQAAAGLWTR